jgi:hypothetical protein
MNGKEEEHTILLEGKSDGKSPLGRPRCTWVDNIKMAWRDRMWRCRMDWSGSG